MVDAGTLKGEHVTTVDARNNFGDLINQAAYGKKRIVLTRRGKELVCLVPIEDMRLLEQIENLMDLEDGQKALKEARKKGTISHDALKKELGLDNLYGR